MISGAAFLKNLLCAIQLCEFSVSCCRASCVDEMKLKGSVEIESLLVPEDYVGELVEGELLFDWQQRSQLSDAALQPPVALSSSFPENARLSSNTTTGVIIQNFSACLVSRMYMINYFAENLRVTANMGFVEPH